MRMTFDDLIKLNTLKAYFKDQYGLDIIVQDNYNKEPAKESVRSAFLQTAEGEYVCMSKIIKYFISDDNAGHVRYYKVCCKLSDGTVHTIKAFSTHAFAILYVKELVKDHD